MLCQNQHSQANAHTYYVDITDLKLAVVKHIAWAFHILDHNT